MSPPAPTDYVELRCRSAFSFLEGASNPEDLAERAADFLTHVRHPERVGRSDVEVDGAYEANLGARDVEFYDAQRRREQPHERGHGKTVERSLQLGDVNLVDLARCHRELDLL